MLSAKTKKYQMPVKAYIKAGMTMALKQFWWAFLVPVAIIILGILLGGGWLWGLLITAIVLTLLYLLFWYIQFYAVSMVPEGKVLFERLSYELNNEHLLIKKNQKEGMMLKWEQVKKAEKWKDAFVIKLSIAQFFYLPFDIFNSENDVKFTEVLLKRKKLL